MSRPVCRERSDSYLRLWLRLLKCSNTVESRVRSRLRDDFQSTLPRFDVLAQLDAAGDDGLTMGELSRRLMVTNGNLTGLTERLVKEKLVLRTTVAHDRRAQRIRLTKAGRKAWQQMAKHHRKWIENMFHEVSESEVDHLYRLLGKLKQSVQEIAKETVK